MSAAALRKAQRTYLDLHERAYAARMARDELVREAIAAGWTQAAVAAEMGITSGRVNQITKGTR